MSTKKSSVGAGCRLPGVGCQVLVPAVSIGEGEVQALIGNQPAEEGIVVVVEPIVNLIESETEYNLFKHLDVRHHAHDRFYKGPEQRGLDPARDPAEV
jgi:hypothetical protein